MTFRVLVADATVQPDDPTVLALRAAGLEVCAVCRHAGVVLDAVARSQPDLALIDRDLPGDGLVAAQQLAGLGSVTVVVRFDQLGSGDLVAALQAGVRSFLPVTLDVRALTTSVIEALGAEPDAIAAPLTEREWDVLARMARGESTAVIAEALEVAPVTIRTHTSAIRRKLGVVRDERDPVPEGCR
jgi:two-component system, NarL family, nitrate/nitrite response regulator NarL